MWADNSANLYIFSRVPTSLNRVNILGKQKKKILTTKICLLFIFSNVKKNVWGSKSTPLYLMCLYVKIYGGNFVHNILAAFRLVFPVKVYIMNNDIRYKNNIMENVYHYYIFSYTT